MNFRDRIQIAINKGTNALQQIILINVAVFVLALFISIIDSLMQINLSHGLSYFYLPSNLSILIIRPWTLITNIFMHQGLRHILLNMIVLYMIGRILQDFISNRKFWFLFMGGAIAGGVLYLISYNIFPAFDQSVDHAMLLGASGGVTAVAVAAGVYLPNYMVYLFGVLRVKLKWIVAVMVLLDIYALPTLANAGGVLAHLGGAIFGALFIFNLKGQLNLPQVNLRGIRRSKMKVVHYDERIIKRKRKAQNRPAQEEIDAILDKINQSGYDSLTSDEKETLIKASE